MAVKFQAIIPDIESAIKIHGSNGMRLLLDIPESELANALYLLEMRGQLLEVSIDGKENTGIGKRHRTPKRTTTPRRNRSSSDRV